MHFFSLIGASVGGIVGGTIGFILGKEEVKKK